MNIDYICDLEKLDIFLSKNGKLRFKNKDAEQYKTGYIHDSCGKCGGMFISVREDAKYCSKECSLFKDLNKKEEYYENKKQTQEKLDESNLYCLVCNKKVINFSSLSSHLKNKHGYKKDDLKKYYDQNIKKFKEGRCYICSEETTYINFVQGYNKFCSQKCSWVPKKEDTNWRCDFINRMSESTQKIWDNLSQEERKELGLKMSNILSELYRSLTDKERMVVSMKCILLTTGNVEDFRCKHIKSTKMK